MFKKREREEKAKWFKSMHSERWRWGAKSRVQAGWGEGALPFL